MSLFSRFRVDIILAQVTMGRKSLGFYLWLSQSSEGWLRPEAKQAHRCPCESALHPDRGQGTESPQELLQLLGTLTAQHFPLQGIKEPLSTSQGLSGER